jgi:F0F1-type ATP synthase assembly protein I
MISRRSLKAGNPAEGSFGVTEPKRFSRIGGVAAVVLEMAALTVGGLYLGAFVDERLSTPPVFLAFFVTLGFFAGVYRLVGVLNRRKSSDD